MQELNKLEKADFIKAGRPGNVGCLMTIVSILLFVLSFIFGKQLIQVIQITFWRTVIRVFLVPIVPIIGQFLIMISYERQKVILFGYHSTVQP
jgi:hypothetical protein